MWSRSFWRHFSTIELFLEDLLKRPVTVSCPNDEPRPWVDLDPCTFMVWPAYDWEIPKKTRVGKLQFLENLVRKCWYEVSSQETCSRHSEAAHLWEEVSINSRSGEKRRQLGASPVSFVPAIHKIHSILQSASVEGWELLEPRFPSILAVHEDVACLAREMIRISERGEDREWREVIERYRYCAAKISNYGAFVMPHFCDANNEKSPYRQAETSRLQ